MAKAIEIVGLEEAIEAGGSDLPPIVGTKFCFNDIQVLKFKDGTSYHIRKQRATISDPKLIANLTEAAKNRHNKIFIES